MSPNFWGCRCCGTNLVATCNSDGWLYVRRISNGGIVWSVPHSVTGTTSFRNIRFLTPKKVAAIDDFYFYIFERDGSSGVQLLKRRDTAARSQSGGDFGLDARDGLIAVYADDNENTNYTGTYNPYTSDYDGAVINVYPFPSPSTVGPFDENAFVMNTTVFLDSEGRGYVCGSPDLTTENSSGVWRIDPNGLVGLKKNTGGFGVGACIDSSDNIVATWGGNTYRLDVNLDEVWSISGGGIHTIRESTGTFFYKSGDNVLHERRIEDGSEVNTYTNAVYSNYFSHFRIDEYSGDVLAGGRFNQGVWRFNPSTDDLIWDGFTTSSITGMDTWYG